MPTRRTPFNAHKDGKPSENVVVRNNLATDYSLQGTNITHDHNTELANNLAAYFVNPAAFDLHLRAGSPAIDAGIAPIATVSVVRRMPGSTSALSNFAEITGS
jgi:hypothetical protein